MLEFTTTTIVNSTDSIFADASKKLFRVKFGPELYNDGTNHVATLLKKTPYVAAKKAKATVTVPTGDGIFRIAMYIRLRNNQNEYFSNDWTFKGKPLYVEFNGGTSAADIVSLAKKYMLAQYGYDLVKFGTSGTDLTIEAVNQWEYFMDQDNNTGVQVQKLQTVDMAGNILGASDTPKSPTHEEFVKDDTVTVTVDNGNEAFGDFAHIVKDLRLPSLANLRWQGIAQGDVMDDEPNDDKPLPTGKYTQYTIQLDSERGIMGAGVVGSLAKSRTTHVFYVESGAVDDFDENLIKSKLVASKTAINIVTATSSSTTTGGSDTGSDGDDMGANID